MNRTGLVLKVEKNTAIIVTKTGEFVKVTTSTNLPKVGETYTGTIKKEKNHIKHIVAAVALFMIFISGGSAYAYYTPTATVQVSINPSIELKINRFDRIIKSSPTNRDGKILLQHLQLKNKNIDEALTLVVTKAKKDNFINDDYTAQGKIVSVKISSKDSDKTIKLNKLEKYIAENKINAKVNNNGKEDNKEFTKTDKDIKIDNNINKQAPVDNTKKQDDNFLNKKDNTIKSDDSKPVEDGSTKNKDNTNNNDSGKQEPKIKEKDMPKDSPSKIRQDKPADKSGGSKEETSSVKKNP